MLAVRLAPRGVCHAVVVTNDAVVSYTTFSPVSLSRKRGMCVFCDTIRFRGMLPVEPPLDAGHPALWSSDFPLWFSPERLPDTTPALGNVN